MLSLVGARLTEVSIELTGVAERVGSSASGVGVAVSPGGTGVTVGGAAVEVGVALAGNTLVGGALTRVGCAAGSDPQPIPNTVAKVAATIPNLTTKSFDTRWMDLAAKLLLESFANVLTPAVNRSFPDSPPVGVTGESDSYPAAARTAKRIDRASTLRAVNGANDNT